MSAGRPRQFDESVVLERAMLLFWEQGYQGTSLAQLREVMGLSSASLYHAFGSKDGVFEKVVEHYVSRPNSVVSLVADDTVDPADQLPQLLHKTIDGQTDPSHPVGCLIALSATVGPADSASKAGQIVAAQRARDRAQIEVLVQRCKDAGVLTPETPVKACAFLVHTFILGIATQLHDSVPPSELHAAADALIAPWLTRASTAQTSSVA